MRKIEEGKINCFKCIMELRTIIFLPCAQSIYRAEEEGDVTRGGSDSVINRLISFRMNCVVRGRNLQAVEISFCDISRSFINCIRRSALFFI